LDFFGHIKKITHVVDADKEPGEQDLWKVLIKGSGKHSLTLVFDEEPTDYPLGWPVQVKISVTQTTLTPAVI
jgi:hypothetical protein